MSKKTLVYIAAFIGSIIGGYIPAIWGGAGLLSISSLLLGATGAILGIVIAVKYF